MDLDLRRCGGDGQTRGLDLVSRTGPASFFFVHLKVGDIERKGGHGMLVGKKVIEMSANAKRDQIISYEPDFSGA